MSSPLSSFFFFFNDTATTEIYTLSLHDALPISAAGPPGCSRWCCNHSSSTTTDRKSTRLNSSHTVISYAVFCLKKKKTANKARIARDDHRSATVRRNRRVPYSPPLVP